jgi:cytochrome P450
MAKVKSLVSTADEAKHGALRNSVAKALTQSATVEYETHLNQAIPELIETLGRHQKVDIS